LIIDESNPICSFGSWIASLVSQEAFSSLKAPIKVLTPPHCPVPAAPNLEAAYLPDADEIILSSENMVNYK
ncbi:MAG TPA: alpha-ketoacid dehydrogenase subunit beta, partial [Acidobacteria bacterium]|nr:alpha-ketoacid dehydrogenase subunit beta [Acidobacteriota bacterium]